MKLVCLANLGWQGKTAARRAARVAGGLPIGERRPRASTPAPQPRGRAWEYVHDLETYRAPRRPPALRVVSPPAPPPPVLRLVPPLPPAPAKGLVRSMGHKPLTTAEKVKLFEDEKELRELGILIAPMSDCDELLASDEPCPWYRCSAHLGLEISQQGNVDSVRLNYPGKEVDELEETCALRFARSHDNPSLAEVGAALGITGARVQQHERDGIRKLLADPEGRRLLLALRDRNAF